MTTAEQRSDLDQRLRGLSRRTLAESLGVDPGTLQGWEAGEHKPVERNVEWSDGFLRTLALEGYG